MADPLRPISIISDEIGFDNQNNLLLKGKKIILDHENTRIQINGTAQSTKDQSVFESYLSVNGAVFNGSTDDAPAIQASLNSLAADNKFHRVAFPGGGLTAAIGSANSYGSGDPIAGSPPNCGIIFPSNIACDFNDITFQVNAAGLTALTTSGAAIAIAGNSNVANAFPVHMQSWTNGTILSNGVGYGLYLGNAAGDRGPDRATLRNLRIAGGGYCVVITHF